MCAVRRLVDDGTVKMAPDAKFPGPQGTFRPLLEVYTRQRNRRLNFGLANYGFLTKTISSGKPHMELSALATT